MFSLYFKGEFFSVVFRILRRIIDILESGIKVPEEWVTPPIDGSEKRLLKVGDNNISISGLIRGLPVSEWFIQPGRQPRRGTLIFESDAFVEVLERDVGLLKIMSELLEVPKVGSRNCWAKGVYEQVNNVDQFISDRRVPRNLKPLLYETNSILAKKLNAVLDEIIEEKNPHNSKNRLSLHLLLIDPGEFQRRLNDLVETRNWLPDAIRLVRKYTDHQSKSVEI